MMLAEIYEVEDTLSANGSDCWEMEVRTGIGQHTNYGDYKTAGDALNHLLSLYGENQLSVNITSLRAYAKMEEGAYA